VRQNALQIKKEKTMDIVEKVKGWVGNLADLGVSLLALTIVAELLGLGSVPFMPEGISVIGNVTGVVETLGSSGLVGLLAVWVLWAIWQRK
jgi:hypothetical protein|tara:strand:- start:10405 stop:10677 length:273 start_codon:yes stop_codon:yes gene_type:complete